MSDRIECMSLIDTSYFSKLVDNNLHAQGLLTIVSMNIRSINCNFDYLLAFVSALEVQVDIIVLTECWTNINNPPPNMDDYCKYWTKNSLNQNDGVVVYVRDTVTVACAFEPEMADGNCLIINIKPDYTLICSYRPPCFKNTKPYLDSLENILGKIRTQHIIFTGDINIDTLPLNLSSTAQEYLNLLAMHGLKLGIDKPTRLKSCIDHFMIKCPYPWRTFVFDQPVTDHSPIVLCINSNKMIKQDMVQNKVRIDYKTIYDLITVEQWDGLYATNDPSIASEILTTKLNEIITNNTRKVKIPNRLRPLKPWITKGIVKCIRRRDTLYKAAVKNPDNVLFMLRYHKYRNMCNLIIKRLKNIYYEDKLRKSNGNIKETWTIIKDVCDMKKGNEPNVDLISTNEPIKSLNTVNAHFTGVGVTLASELLDKMNKTEHELSREAAIDTSPLNSMSFVPTDSSEVRNIVLGLKTHSAPGWDKIAAFILKQNIIALTQPITFLCNLSLMTGIFPGSFKTAIVCPVYKSGSRSEPNNYRPISLLPTLSKILEKIVNRRLIGYLEDNRFLSDAQFGFRKAKSTEDAVLALTSTMVAQIDKGDKCLGIFLDLQKAFDTVSIPILITRMENVGIRGLVLKWFTSYLTQRQQRVRVSDCESANRTCIYGVPQGSTLGPTLFLVYINDLCRVITLPNLDLFMFADDTVLVARGRNWDTVFRLAETGLARVTSWLENSLMALNISKTKYVCFSKTSAGQPAAECTLKIHNYPCNRTVLPTECGCEVLSRVSSVKYLGVVLDQHLGWGPHIAATVTRIRKLIYIFKKLRTVANDKLLVQVYRALCECIIKYCICVWGGAAKTHMIEMERAQRVILKVLLRVSYRYPTSSLYARAGVLSVRKMFIYDMLRRYHRRYVPRLPLSQKRTESCPLPRIRSTFARRHFDFLAPYIYNKHNKNKKLQKVTNTKFKIQLIDWLKSMDYEDVENILRVDL